jgi:hypothetical protein
MERDGEGPEDDVQALVDPMRERVKITKALCDFMVGFGFCINEV